MGFDSGIDREDLEMLLTTEARRVAAVSDEVLHVIVTELIKTLIRPNVGEYTSGIDEVRRRFDVALLTEHEDAEGQDLDAVLAANRSSEPTVLPDRIVTTSEWREPSTCGTVSAGVLALRAIVATWPPARRESIRSPRCARDKWQPPRLVLWIVERATPADREAVTGELIEDFYRLAESNRRAARRWCRRQAIRSLVPGLKRQWATRGLLRPT
jgi:hypothetical protein